MKDKNIIVIKYGGSLMDNRITERSILKNIQKFSERNFVVVVHGGGKKITDALRKANIKTKFVNGLRYTDKQSIKIVENVLEKVQSKIAEKLKKAVAVKKVITGKRIKTLGYVGKFVSAEIPEIKRVIARKKIAVISSVGKSKNGYVLNFNADEAAAGIASQLRAKKLIFFTSVKGVLDSNKKTIPVIKVLDIKGLIAKKIITGGMIPKMQGCAKAIKNGVDEVDIVNRNLKGTRII